MKLWLRYVVLLCAVFEIYCATDDVKEVKIISITRKLHPTDSTTQILHLVFDLNGNAITVMDDVKTTTLEVITPRFEIPLLQHTDQDNSGDYGIFFVGDISKYLSLQVDFILDGRGTHMAPVIFGKATFIIPATAIDGDVIQALKVGKEGKLDSLRLTTSTDALLGGWKVCTDAAPPAVPLTDLYCTGTDDAETNPCFAIEVGTTATKFSLCVGDENGGQAVLISGTFTPTESGKGEDTDITEAWLTYGYGAFSTKTNPKMKISSTYGSTLEFVPYAIGDKVYAAHVCTGTGVECDLKDYSITNGEMSILIVNGVTTTETSNIITLTDYNIEGTHLGDDIIETYWIRGDETFYGASIAKSDDPATSLHDTIIDCSTTANTYCFAYFINLDKAEHLVTITPATDKALPAEGANLDLKNTNHITTKPITTAKTNTKRILDITLLQDPNYTDGVMQVCYKKSESNHNNTRDEAILFNEDGQWIKIYQSTEEDLIHCFSPVNLLTSSLRITEVTKLTVVIVERDLSGYQALASGQADIDLSALRVIKPEIDNSSERYISTLAIVGAAIGGVACLMALVIAAIMFIMQRRRNNDGLQYPLHRTNIQDSNIIIGLDSPYPTM